jgi:hypothetical protein
MYMMDLFLDAETFYDRQYSLRKLTTAEYVLSPSFECYMVGWAIGTSPVQVTVGAENVQKLMRLLPWPELRVVCHNIHFDAAVAAWRMKVPRPGRWACSMAAMRAAHPEWPRHSLDACGTQLGLGAKHGALAKMSGVRWSQAPLWLQQEMIAYTAQDIDLLRQIWAHRPASFDGTEGDYLDLTVRLWTEPRLYLDPVTLIGLKARAEHESASRLQRIAAYGIGQATLRSDQQLAAALKDMSCDVPYKTSPTTGKLVPAFAKNDFDMVQWAEGHRGPFFQDLAEARMDQRSTIERTRVERLTAIAYATKSILPVPLVFGNTNTGRLAGGEKLNLQNLPRTEDDRKTPHPLRQSIIVKAPWRIVRVDAAQIECRILAWWARETWLNKAFANGWDPYCMFGTGMFGYEVTKGSWERLPSKIAVLSLGYGASEAAFRAMLVAQKIAPGLVNSGLPGRCVSFYRNQCSNIVQLWRETGAMLSLLMGEGEGDDGPLAMLEAMGVETKPTKFQPVKFSRGKATLPSGREMIYPRVGRMSDKEKSETGVDFYWVRRGIRKRLYGSLLVENAVQAMARDVVMEAWRRIDRNYPWIGIALQVHDDLAAVVHVDRAEEALAVMKAELAATPSWAPGLVLGSDGGIAVRLGEAVG